jgi:hypothetical protein
VSGTVRAARACWAAALAGGGGEGVLPPPVPPFALPPELLVLVGANRLESCAAAALQLPFTEHLPVLGQVRSAAAAAVQGSYTVSVLVALATFPALSLAV